MSQPTRSTTIDALARGVDLLEILGERESVKLADLPALLGTSRATAFRVVKTLTERGYVEHVPSQKTYRLGPSALLLSLRSQSFSFIRLAGPALRDIADKTSETVNLALFRGGHLVYVEIVDGRHALRMSEERGQRIPIHATALGKATLATLGEETSKELLGDEPYEAFTVNTISSWKRLKPEIATTAERGYALDVEEMDDGVTCVGAAIRDAAGHPLGGISVSGWSQRLGEPEREQVGRLLASWCTRISAELARSPNGHRPAAH